MEFAKPIAQISSKEIEENPICAALQCCTRIRVSDDQFICRKREIDGALEGLENLRSSLSLGIERLAMEETKRSIADLVKLGDRLNHIELLSKSYAVLDLAPFLWRDKDGLPRVQIFGLDKPTMYFRGRDGKCKTNIPNFLIRFYKDVIDKLEKDSSRLRNSPNDRFKTEMEAISKFEHTIPLDVKAKVNLATAVFCKSNIFVIADMGWRVEERKIAVKDPLIVGYDPLTEGFWLIAAFDLTPIEQLIKSEFSVELRQLMGR